MTLQGLRLQAVLYARAFRVERIQTGLGLFGPVRCIREAESYAKMKGTRSTTAR